MHAARTCAQEETLNVSVAPSASVVVIVSRWEGDANQVELLSDPSAKIPGMSDRRRRNDSAMSSGWMPRYLLKRRRGCEFVEREASTAAAAPLSIAAAAEGY